MPAKTSPILPGAVRGAALDQKAIVLPLEGIKAKLYSTCKRFADNSE
jgi:hypothetical protein